MLIEKIQELIKNKDMEALKNTIAAAGEMELLQAYYDLSSEEQVIVFRLLNKDDALTLFEELDTEEQENLLHSFTDEKIIEYLSELAPDDRVRLLDELPAKVAKKFIASFNAKDRQATNVLLGYPPETAGRLMTTEYISLKKDMTVAEALAKIRVQAKDKETIYTLFVTDGRKKMQGVVTLKELLTSNLDDKIVDIMSDKAVYVFTDTDQEEVAQTLQELDLLAIPVVDKEQRLVGIVTIDDALDILQEEATEDLLTQGGLVASAEATRSDLLVRGSYWKIWKVRLPFLFVAILGGLLAALVMEGFEETLASVVGVAFFIPLIMDLGGSVGTQSSTVFARGVALGHIQFKNFFRHFIKEVSVGASIGVVTGTICGLIAGVWQGMPMLGLAVGLALFATTTLAASIGFLIPFLILKLNFDQAAGSAPLVTTIKDVAGLLIYFGLVTLLLGHLIGSEAYECYCAVCAC